MSKKKPAKPTAHLEEEIAAIVVPSEPDWFVVLDEASAQWDSLIKQFETGDRVYWSMEKRVDSEKRLKELLPDDAARDLFFEWNEAKDNHDIACEEAAFHAGVAVGKRLAGGAR